MLNNSINYSFQLGHVVRMIEGNWKKYKKCFFDVKKVACLSVSGVTTLGIATKLMKLVAIGNYAEYRYAECYDECSYAECC
jgi:hypothetical protein